MRRPIVLLSAVVCTVGLVPQVAHASTASRSAPARAGHLRVSALSSTSATLAWTNPGSRSFAGTEIRYASGTVAPATASSGRHGVRVARSRHTATLTRLTPGATYTASLFTTDGHGHWSSRVSTRVVTAPGPVTNLRSYDEGTTTLLTWTLPRTASLSRVAVRYARGGVAPARPSSGTPVPTTTAKATSAHVTGLAKGTRYSVSVFALDKAGHASTPAVARFTTVSDPDADGMVTGLVTDTAGHPLAGARIEPLDVTYATSAGATTGADGRFTVEAPAGTIGLIIDGDNATGGISDATGYQTSFVSETVRSGVTADSGTVALLAGGAVAVHVTDAGGAPLAGAEVYAMPPDPYVQIGFGISFYSYDSEGAPTTDAHGDVTLRGAPGDQALEICASDLDAGYASHCARRTVLPIVGRTSAPSTVALPQMPTGSVTGRVHLGDRALAGAVVDVVSLGKSAGSDSVGRTDSHGVFQVQGLAPGRYQACSLPYTGASGGRSGAASTCAAGVTVTASTTTITDVAATAGAGVTGTVTGPHGVPVPGAVVSSGVPDDDDPFSTGGSATVAVNAVAGGQTVTDSHGHYRLTGLAAVPQQVCVAPAGALPGAPTGVQSGCAGGGGAGTVALKAGRVRSGVDVVLPVGAAITGTVRDASGTPQEGAYIFVDAPDDEDSNGGFAQTDAQGRYSVLGLPSDSYEVCVATGDTTSGPDQDSCHRPVSARAGTSTRVDLVVPTPTGIDVTVRDRNGDPVAGADAVAIAPCDEDGDGSGGDDGGDDDSCVPVLDSTSQGEPAASEITASDGVASLDGLDPGPYVVCVYTYYATTASGGSPTGYADRCSATTLNLVVTTRHTTVVDVTIQDGAAVTGRVTDSAGHPLGGVQIAAGLSASNDYPGAGENDGVALSFPGQVPDQDAPGSADVTAADGTYTVLGVRPGDSTVCADPQNASGSAPNGYLDECIGGTPGDSDAGTTLHFTSGAVTTAADLALVTGSSISGTVRSTAKKALSGIEVGVFTGRSADNGVQVSVTDSAGHWRSAALAPGKYTVCFVGKGWAGQCWKAVPWDFQHAPAPLAKATLVTTTSGNEATGVDATLTPQR